MKDYKWRIKTPTQVIQTVNINGNLKQINSVQQRDSDVLMLEASEGQLQTWLNQCHSMIHYPAKPNDSKIGRKFIIEKIEATMSLVRAADYIVSTIGKNDLLAMLRLGSSLEKEANAKYDRLNGVVISDLREVSHPRQATALVQDIIELTKKDKKIRCPSLTHQFIMKQHTKFTNDEKQYLSNKGNMMQVAVNELKSLAGDNNLPNYLPYHNKGYSFNEMTQLIKIPGNTYLGLSAYQREQLILNLLPQLIAEQEKEIASWELRASQIIEVAEHLKYNIKNPF